MGEYLAGRSYVDFAAECRQVAKQMRSLDKDLKKDLGKEVKDTVAVPLAAKIRGAATGPWAPALQYGTRVRASADPAIVIGGTRKVLQRGGGSPRNVVYGTEFGGGNRVVIIRSTSRGGKRGAGNFSRSKRTGGVLFKRRSTAQFRGNHNPFIFSTINNNHLWILEKWAEAVDRIMTRHEL